MRGGRKSIIYYWHIKKYKKRIWLLLILCFISFLVGILCISCRSKKKAVDENHFMSNTSSIEVVKNNQEKSEEKKNMGTEKYQVLDQEVIQGTERGVEIRAVSLQSHLKNGDLIDVRIRYPDGEEYVVLSKRCCHELSQEEGKMTLFLTEEEILLLSSSMVDCLQMNGKLYTVRYLRDRKEEPATITYLPSKTICDLIKGDPNIIGKAESVLSNKNRKELEERISFWKEEEMEIDKAEEIWSGNPYETERKEEGEVQYID